MTQRHTRRLLRDVDRLQAEVARLTAGLQEIAAMQWDAPAEIARETIRKADELRIAIHNAKQETKP